MMAEHPTSQFPGFIPGVWAIDPDSSEKEDWRDTEPAVASRACLFKNLHQNEISVAPGFMEIAAWAFVVTVVGEDAALRVEAVGPIRIAHACNQDKHFECPPDLPAFAKSSLTINAHKTR